MKKTNLLILPSLLLASCVSNTDLPVPEYIPGVQVEAVTINGIKLSTSETQIIQILGEPLKSVEHGYNHMIGGQDKTIYYKGLEIRLNEGEIQYLECTGSECVTGLGIRIGDSRAKVEEVYGLSSDYYRNEDQIFYPFKLNEIYINSALFFVFENNRLVTMGYNVDNS